MRAASGALVSLLNSQAQFYVADLLTIVQKGGATTRITSADVAIVANGFTFQPGGDLSTVPPFTRGRTRLVVGLDVDNLSLVLMPSPTVHTLNGVPWPAACATGALDEARITLERAYMTTFGNTAVGTLMLFGGRVGLVTPSRSAIQLEVVSDLELLRAPMPRNTYQPGCVHTLFDGGCGLVKSSFAVSGTAQAGSTVNALNVSLAQGGGYFDLGTITFTSGANAGTSRTIKSYSGGVIVPLLAFTAAPATGDAFTAYPGCDKLQATCSSKFANLARFRGFPYVPTPENAR